MSFLRSAVLAPVAIVALGLTFVGCQKDSGTGPTEPGLTPAPMAPGQQGQSGGQRTNRHDIWGLYDVAIDPVTCNVEVVPLRGGQWHANVVEFLQPPYPPTNIRISVDVGTSDPDNGYFEADVTLTHPFPDLPLYRGFDVRGAFLADGTYTSEYDSGAKMIDPDPAANEARVLNPDGYIRWFNPVEFNLGPRLLRYQPAKYGTTDYVTSTLNPFKYFSDDFLSSATKNLTLQEVNIDPGNRGSFSPTSSITRRYMIQFTVLGGVPIFKFSYLVDASYADPDPAGAPNYPLDSFPEEANTQELFKIAVTDADGTVYYENETSSGGIMKFYLELFDWQAPSNVSGVIGEIGSVIVESPTLLENYGGMIDLTTDFATNAVSGWEQSSVAYFELVDATPSGQQNQYLLFTVTSADPTDYSNPFEAPYPTEPVLAAYYMWEVPVSPEFVNTLPELGPIIGDDVVDETDQAAMYSPDLTDPDPGQTHTFMWSLVPDGDPVAYSIAPTEPDGSLVIDWCSYPVSEYDMQVQVDDGFDYAESPVLDITRELSPCTGGAHVYSGTSTYPVYSAFAYSSLPRLDIDFFRTGPMFGGQGVVQMGPSTLMNFEIDSTGSMSPPLITYRWPISMGDLVLSLDASPDIDPGDGYTDDRLVMVLKIKPDVITVYDANVFLGGPLMTILPDTAGSEGIPCVAIDEEDDIWALARSGGDTLTLEHWTYIVDDNSGGPYYTFEAGDSLDVSSEIGWDADVFDMVIAYLNNNLYVLEGGPNPDRGMIHQIDLNTSPPTYVKSVGGPSDPIFSDVMRFEYYAPLAQATGADIMIDRMEWGNCDPDEDQHCRLVVISWLDVPDARPTEVVRLDLDLNIIDTQQTPSELYWPSCGLTTNSDEGERFLVCPSTDHVDVWDPDADW